MSMNIRRLGALGLYFRDSFPEAFDQIFLGHPLSEDNEDGVIACHRTEYFRNSKDVKCKGNTVGMSLPGFDYSNIAAELNGDHPAANILNVAFFLF